MITNETIHKGFYRSFSSFVLGYPVFNTVVMYDSSSNMNGVSESSSYDLIINNSLPSTTTCPSSGKIFIIENEDEK